MKRKFAAGSLAVALAVGGLLFASPAMADDAPTEGPATQTQVHKVLVCKYVGTPGVDERLKEGKNPISVDQNALEDGFKGEFPWEFSDAQGKSVAVAWDEGQEYPESLCPKPEGPVVTKITAPTPTFEDPCGVNNLTVTTPETKGIVWSVNQVGNKTKVAATAAEGYELEGTTTWEFKDSGVLCPPTNAVCEAPGKGPLGTNLNGLWKDVDTRSAGHSEYVDGGLKVWTDDASSNAKVSLGTAADFPLSQTGAVALDWTGTTPAPGVNLFVDFDNDGDVDGTLVYESVYGQDLWLTNGSQQFVKDAAPSHTGGNGSENHGTINEWLTAFGNAQVKGIAFSLGSGVHGDGVITSITVGCKIYTFDYEEKVVEPEPTVVTLVNPEWNDECGVENDGVWISSDTEGVDYTWKSDDPESADYGTLLALIGDGYVVEGPPAGWTAIDGGYQFVIPMTDKPCEVTPTPKPEPTTPTAPSGEGKTPVKPAGNVGTLAQTGGDMNPIVPLVGGVAVMLGLGTLVLRRLVRR